MDFFFWKVAGTSFIFLVLTGIGGAFADDFTLLDKDFAEVISEDIRNSLKKYYMWIPIFFVVTTLGSVAMALLVQIW